MFPSKPSSKSFPTVNAIAIQPRTSAVARTANDCGWLRALQQRVANKTLRIRRTNVTLIYSLRAPRCIQTGVCGYVNVTVSSLREVQRFREQLQDATLSFLCCAIFV